MVMVEVLIEAFERTWWQAYQRTLEGRFEQESIHIRALAVETP
jgi:hypothetical protein